MKQKKNGLNRILGLLSLIILGALVGFFIGKMLNGNPSSTFPKEAKFALFALLVPIFILVIAWHEGGHAVAGVAQGFDFKIYVVGPFMWEKQNGQWHFKWNANVNTAGGLVVCLPTDTVNLAQRFTVFAAAGPFASLLLTVLSYSTYAIVFKNNTSTELSTMVLSSFFLLTAVLSFVIFVATAIPFQTGGFYTDGARVLRLQQGGEKAQFDILMLKAVTNSSIGLRPKLMNTNELEEALAIAKRINEPFGVYLHGYLHQVAFDKNDLEDAEKHLQNYVNEVDNIPEGIKNGVWLDAAFFYAFGRKDLAQAEHFLSQYKPSPIVPKAQILATEAAFNYLKNDFDTALLKINKALKELPNMMDKGVGVALENKLTQLKSEIEGTANR